MSFTTDPQRFRRLLEVVQRKAAEEGGLRPGTRRDHLDLIVDLLEASRGIPGALEAIRDALPQEAKTDPRTSRELAIQELRELYYRHTEGLEVEQGLDTIMVPRRVVEAILGD